MTRHLDDVIAAYDVRAGALADAYEGIRAEAAHADLLDCVPRGRGLLALDVGAGSGRDAAWLAALGHEVVAAEPSPGMRSEARRRHPDPRIRWLDDRLPDLGEVHRLGLAFDLVLLSAVWTHVPPAFRARAFRKVVTLLRPGGVILMTLREGRVAEDRPSWPAPPGEVESLALTHGLAVVRSVASADRLGRADVRWTSLCLRLPDDGAGALPLLRGIVLDDGKSSTYKLALLRAVARVADATPALAVQRSDDGVDVPLGIVALNWVRTYLPLVAAGLPQAPGNSGPEGLAFAKEGFRGLLALGVNGQDLRVGARFTGERAAAVSRALAEARRTIADMPAKHTRIPHSDQRVFEAAPARPRRVGLELVLDADALREHGTLSVPGHVWRTLQRFGSWVEPVLVAEWARLVRSYGDRMGMPIVPGRVEGALAWLDPARDTHLARLVATRVFEREGRLTCVWTGERLGAHGFDVDHCLPWSAWPCGDLWNLMPASTRVNQRLKRDRLPSASALADARRAIVTWWGDAWLSDPALRARFEREAAASLPLVGGGEAEDVFAALEWRRLRLRQDQQVREWSGA